MLLAGPQSFHQRLVFLAHSWHNAEYCATLATTLPISGFASWHFGEFADLPQAVSADERAVGRQAEHFTMLATGSPLKLYATDLIN